MSAIGFRPVLDGPLVPVQRVTKNARIITTRRTEVALQSCNDFIAENGGIGGIPSGLIRTAIRLLQDLSVRPIIYDP